LTQLQLDELIKKKKVQAAVREVEDQSAVLSAMNIPSQAPQIIQQAPVNMGQNVPINAGNPQQPNAPIVNYLPEHQDNRNRTMLGRGRQYNNQ